MTAPAREKRTSKPVLVRLTADEYRDLERLAMSNDMTMPAVLRAGLHLLLTTEKPR